MSCAIAARGLSYRYPNGVAGLDGVDLDVATASASRCSGPNGAGKTTLMLHLNGLLSGSGTLSVAGLRVGNGDARSLRARVGLVFQDPDDQFFMPTVREDVAFGPLNLGCRATRPASGWTRRWPPSGWSTSPTARRTSSRSASAGAWRSPPCSRCARRCWCSTSRRPTSIRARGASCSRCSTRSRRRCSSSRTTSRSPPSCARGRSCSRRAGSSPTAPAPRSSATPGCSPPRPRAARRLRPRSPRAAVN